MSLTLPHELRDPIHGLMRLTELERKIINTPVFQRLRRIRQLAMADLVYPGALHTRFEHSLGTMHIAQRILANIAETRTVSDEEFEIVRLSALLHDIGHGPFSHVSEYILDQFYDRDAVGTAPLREKIHEKITVDIIGQDPDLRRLLTEAQRDGVIQIIQGTGQRDYRRDIVSSALDADKMDYLLRDAYFAGVRYGYFDLEKVIESCVVVEDGQQSYLMVDEPGIFAMEQLVLSKHHMTHQVYAHRVRVITDYMIVRGLELAIESDPEIRRAYAYDGTDDQLEIYLALDDAKLWAAVLSCASDRAREIFQRLRDRRLFKQVATLRLDEHTISNILKLNRLRKLSAEQKRQLEERVAEALGCEPWEVIVERKDVKNPAYQVPGTFDPEAIYVVARDRTPKPLSQFEELSTSARPSAERLHVIGPLDEDPDLPRDERRERRAELEQRITELILQA